jgi:hypothetical protein
LTAIDLGALKGDGQYAYLPAIPVAAVAAIMARHAIAEVV